MKLATLKDGTRDGKLIVVSRDLGHGVCVDEIASTMQQALDHWQQVKAQLTEVSNRLNQGALTTSFAFDPKAAMAPLPRAYQWADGSAYVNHVELVRKARGAQIPDTFWTDPLMYQGGSDAFIGGHEDIRIEKEEWGIDFEAEVAVVTDDVAMGSSSEQALSHIALIMLVNDISLRNLIPAELGKGFGFFQSKPACAFSPVAVTPDELGQAWDGRRVHLPLVTHLNNKLYGEPNAGVDMTFDFPQLIAHAAKTRHLVAGTIIGSGTVSNADRTSGSSCLAEQRMLETIEFGQAKTPFMRFGDRVRIEMFDNNGASIFGAIDQQVVPYHVPATAEVVSA